MRESDQEGNVASILRTGRGTAPPGMEIFAFEEPNQKEPEVPEEGESVQPNSRQLNSPFKDPRNDAFLHHCSMDLRRRSVRPGVGERFSWAFVATSVESKGISTVFSAKVQVMMPTSLPRKDSVPSNLTRTSENLSAEKGSKSRGRRRQSWWLELWCKFWVVLGIMMSGDRGGCLSV
jgi:hypothetical protein